MRGKGREEEKGKVRREEKRGSGKKREQKRGERTERKGKWVASLQHGPHGHRQLRIPGVGLF